MNKRIVDAAWIGVQLGILATLWKESPFCRIVITAVGLTLAAYELGRRSISYR